MLRLSCAPSAPKEQVAWKREIAGGTLALIGYMLSPLSWWNDMFINVPLALAFAWVISLFWPSAFGVSCGLAIGSPTCSKPAWPNGFEHLDLRF
jgi:hypothetical protein